MRAQKLEELAKPEHRKELEELIEKGEVVKLDSGVPFYYDIQEKCKQLGVYANVCGKPGRFQQVEYSITTKEGYEKAKESIEYLFAKSRTELNMDNNFHYAIANSLKKMRVRPIYCCNNIETYLNEDFDRIKNLSVFFKFLCRREDLSIDKVLSNLERLQFHYHTTTFYAPRTRVTSIANRDYENINQPGLTELHIENQRDLTEIDVSKFPNLKKLTIDGNLNLRKIKGLETLKYLEEFTCIGNEILHTLDSLPKVIENNNISKLNLDVMLFPDAIRYKWDKETAEYDRSLMSKIYYLGDDVKWKQEVLSINADRQKSLKFDELSTEQMIEMHNEACKILRDNIPPGASKKDTILGIELYVAQNVKYNHEALKLHKRPASVNAAYDCIVNKIAVCEGITRGSQYMNKLRNIKSRNVGCYPDKNANSGIIDFVERTYKQGEMSFDANRKGDYHAIICYVDYFNLYSDITASVSAFGSGNRGLVRSLMTKKAIHDKCLVLSNFEIGVENEEYAQKPWEIRKSIDTCALFAKQTQEKMMLSQINEMRTGIKVEMGRPKGEIVL